MNATQTMRHGAPDERSNRGTARLAGILYLALALLGPFSVMYVPSQMLVPGDGAASMAHVLDQQGLFRAGMVVDALVFLIEIVLTVLLYRLLESVHRTLSMMAAFARLAMTVIQGANLGISLVTLRLAENAQPGLVLVSLLAHADVVLVWQAFFGLHCVLLGILVHRSGFFPRVLGVLLLFASAGYLSDSFGRLVSVSYGDHFGWVVAPPAVVGELSFTLWLLLKGAGSTRPS
jgi:hypothetical protein